LQFLFSKCFCCLNPMINVMTIFPYTQHMEKLSSWADIMLELTVKEQKCWAKCRNPDHRRQIFLYFKKIFLGMGCQYNIYTMSKGQTCWCIM
jgi:hypothetical protein